MPRKTSAGLLLYRWHDRALEVLLVHPGGPLWQGEDDGAWSIPKGEHDSDEQPLDAARREFAEETGLHPAGPFLELTPVRLRSGKLVRAWAVAGDCDPASLQSINFQMEWPPHSGRIAEFPEVDRAAFFTIAQARRKLNPGQVPFLDDLQAKLRDNRPPARRFDLPVTCILLFLALAGCGDDGPTSTPASPTWRKFAGNPVLVGGSHDLSEWDADGVGTPCVLRLGPDSLLMWYTGRAGDARHIGLATSRDGKTWNKYASNPVLDTGTASAWDGLAVEHPNVRFDGTRFTLYYAGSGQSQAGIGIATSADGIHWTPAVANPVFAAGPSGVWDDARVSMPWVLFDGSTYEMWYTGQGDYVAIGYATSNDGIQWNRLTSPVLHPQALEALTFAPCVRVGNGLYRIWYGALHESPGGGVQPGVLDLAQSFDGVDWTKHRTVLGPGPAGSWDAHAILGACVLQEGARLEMWFTAEQTVRVGDSTVLVSAIGYAIFE